MNPCACVLLTVMAHPDADVERHVWQRDGGLPSCSSAQGWTSAPPLESMVVTGSSVHSAGPQMIDAC
jgi:hypothetical protein